MKRWCCFFTCLATRAVHTEIVSSLDTDSCFVAVNRFIGRGQPVTINSDDGSNFGGSNRELKENTTAWNKDHIMSELAQKHIVWKFTPPGAPQLGGV